MIDKITPRPSDAIAADLEALGVENMAPVITSKRTYIAPFINAEQPQYLVIEDRFPNGRPELEKGFGVYLADRATVNLSERMKVTACLNPVHSATGPVGVVLGEELYAKMLNTNPDMMKMARMVAYDEGLPMVEDPRILSPRRSPTNSSPIASRMSILAIRICGLPPIRHRRRCPLRRDNQSLHEKYGSAERLTAIPLGIAGWLRYMLGVDDMGNTYELAPDPMVPEIQTALSSVVFGNPESLTDQLHPILSNEKVFFIDLYKAGLGEKIEGMFREMIAGKGSTKATIHKYMNL